MLKLPSGQQSVFDNRVGWANTYLRKAGLLSRPKRGCVQITQRGKDVLADNPIAIDNLYLQRFAEFREFRERSTFEEPLATAPNDTPVSTTTSEETISKAVGTSNSKPGFVILSFALTSPLLEVTIECSLCPLISTSTHKNISGF